MSTQKPSVGRIVHVGVDVGGKLRPRPGVIYDVEGDTVTVEVFGDQKHKGVTPYAETLTAGHWSWPPRVE